MHICDAQQKQHPFSSFNKYYQFYWDTPNYTTMLLTIMIVSCLFALGQPIRTHPSHHVAPTLSQTITGFQTLQSNADASSRATNFIRGDAELTAFLESVIKSQVSDLQSFESSLIPQFSLSPSACANLSDPSTMGLLQRVEQAQSSVESLVVTVNQIPNATIKDDLLRRASLQYLYLDQVRSALQRQCTQQQPVTIATTAYFYNLASNNWVYGSQVQTTDLTNLYFNLSQHGTVTVCPIQAPFVQPGGLSCFNCSDPTPLYDLTLQMCTSCPGNTTFDVNAHQCGCPSNSYSSSSNYCLPKIPVYLPTNNPNTAGLTPQSIQQYQNTISAALNNNPSTTSQQCAFNQFSVVTACITCPPNTYFVVDYYQCLTCSSFDPTTKICNTPTTSQSGTPQTVPPLNIPAVFNSQNTVGLSRIIASNPAAVQTGGVQCPDVTPFYTGTGTNLCIQCPAYFDWDRKTCVSCPPGTALVAYQCR